MTTITQRKKLSKGTWALVFIVIAAIIAIAVLAAVGYINLAFLAAWLVSVMTFGTSSYINAIIVLAIPLVGGIVLSYIVTQYFIGQKVTTNPISTGYNPQPTTPTPAQSGKETVIS